MVILEFREIKLYGAAFDKNFLQTPEAVNGLEYAKPYITICKHKII